MSLLDDPDDTRPRPFRMKAIIENVAILPPCASSGKLVTDKGVTIDLKSGAGANCPSCGRFLWLTDWPSGKGSNLDFYFPEHPDLNSEKVVNEG